MGLMISEASVLLLAPSMTLTKWPYLPSGVHTQLKRINREVLAETELIILNVSYKYRGMSKREVYVPTANYVPIKKSLVKRHAAIIQS